MWKLVNLKKWMKVFDYNYRHHLEMLDKFLFPLLENKAREQSPADLAGLRCTLERGARLSNHVRASASAPHV